MTQTTAYQIETSPSPSGIRTYSWNAERRQRAAERIRAHKPWLKTTGPKTAAGKSVSKMNALKHGQRSAAEIAKHREVMKFLREQKLFLKDVRMLLRIRRQAAKLKKPTNEMIEGWKNLPCSHRNTSQQGYSSHIYVRNRTYREQTCSNISPSVVPVNII